MISGRRVRWIDVLVMVTLGGFCAWKFATRAPAQRDAKGSFAEGVRLDPLYATAVQADGRLRSFESHAKAYMGYVAGPRSINGQSNGFTYLDLIFRPERYADADIVFVKNKQVLIQILQALEGHPAIDEARREAILKSRLISRALLREPDALALLRRLERDLIRTSKSVDALESALAVSDARFLQENLRVVPPPQWDAQSEWLSITRLASAGSAPADAVHAGMNQPASVEGLEEERQAAIAGAWVALRGAWRGEDTAEVNRQIDKLAGAFRAAAGGHYPSAGRLTMESWYFRNKSMTWIWLLYLAAVIPLLMSIIYKWDGARVIGMVLFALAFAFHTASVAVRWYISGRWPNSNMFEAVTTSAWFGGVAALILERVARRSMFRNIFALGSAVMSMGALMAAYFLPAQLDSTINNKMAALNDVWLYIHTNMIIWSYAVIGLACIPALLMLRDRWCLLWDGGEVPKVRLLVLPIALAVLNYTAYLLLMHVINNPAQGLSGSRLLAAAGGLWGSLMIVALELSAGRRRAANGLRFERAAQGGASAMILGGSSGAGTIGGPRTAPGEVFDGATMVLVELAFIMLFTGLVMGAIWADHSWGRPWGWDPKEVFALNTFIIFLILIHVRLKVRDKAFWTAVIAVVGFEVMMFNWIVVNFVITGLHSYA